MSDELRRRFRDKIQGRPAAGRRQTFVTASPPGDEGVAGTEEAGGPETVAGTDETTGTGETTGAGRAAAAVRVRDLDHGPFPDAARLNAHFVPGASRVRLTIDLGEPILDRTTGLGTFEREQILSLCPRLLDHECGDRACLGGLLSEPATPGAAGRSCPDGQADGLAFVHLIEHVAIDLAASVPGSTRCCGAACAYRDRPDRFDLFLEGAEPALGRAAAVLATAAVRDVLLGVDRAPIHRRCRDLLTALATRPRDEVVAEDVAEELGWTVTESLEALEALARLGYLDPIPAAFTFSSATGTIFHRAAPQGPPDR